MNKRTFAREWLWWVGCWPVAYIISAVVYYRDLKGTYYSDLGVNALEIMGFRDFSDVMADPSTIFTSPLVAIPVYLAIGLVRVTLWSLATTTTAQPPSGSATSPTA